MTTHKDQKTEHNAAKFEIHVGDKYTWETKRRDVSAIKK